MFETTESVVICSCLKPANQVCELEVEVEQLRAERDALAKEMTDLHVALIDRTEKLYTAIEALEIIGENDAAYATAFRVAGEALAKIKGEELVT